MVALDRGIVYNKRVPVGSGLVVLVYSPTRHPGSRAPARVVRGQAAGAGTEEVW